MARHELAGDCLVWNGDTLVSDALMAKVLSNRRAGICVTIDRKDNYDADDMKVVVDADGRLRQIGKRISAGVNAESIGLLAFRDGGAEHFCDAIDEAMRAPEGTTIWYLRVIHKIAQSGDVWTLDISGEEWGEVDFPADVDSARSLVKSWDDAGRDANTFRDVGRVR
jgi:choline kinase